ncbi:MAG: ABC transporter substrate-binding protein [Verrucomicrobia bacterium]|nr:ABC transporter substrate-binding protein [Verrucomicrobiota bacterium]
MHKIFCFYRWACTAWVAVVALLLNPICRAAIADQKGIGFSLEKASPGTDVPQVQTSLGMRPYANDLIFVAGIKQGFYKDVGLSITPAPYGRKVLPDQAIPLLVNKQVDFMALYPPDVIATMDSVKNIRFIALTDLFQGFAILARPGSNVKTVGQFMADGLGFNEAIKRTMSQLEGKGFVTAPVVDNRIFLETVFSLAGMKMDKDTKLVVTPDATALQLESGGKVDFASPTGAPFTAQLRFAGWIPLVTPLDVLANMPAGPGSPTAALVGTPGVACDADWARQHAETVLRFTSVMFRIIEQEQKNSELMLRSMLDYVNSFAGTSLDISGLKLTIDALSPLSNFDFQKNYFDNQNSALYYRTAFDAAVKFNVDKGVLPKSQYDADDIIWASDVYHELLALKQAADDALQRVEGKSLSAENQALVEKAKQFHAWYDYLDAYRLLRAATQ